MVTWGRPGLLGLPVLEDQLARPVLTVKMVPTAHLAQQEPLAQPEPTDCPAC